MTTGRNMSSNAGVAPRVFISYARIDGEQFATKLRQRLEAEHIPLWQDRVGREGGKDWWLQITQALDKVEFLVLVMTPAAMRSETVRNEETLPAHVQSLVVDAMQPYEAVELLSFGLQTGEITTWERQLLRVLVPRLGEWALLLKLANGVLRDRVGRGEALANALVYLNKALDRRDLTAFDAENAQARNAAVSATLRVSFELLRADQYARYQELAVYEVGSQRVASPNRLGRVFPKRSLLLSDCPTRPTSARFQLPLPEPCRLLSQHTALQA